MDDYNKLNEENKNLEKYIEKNNNILYYKKIYNQFYNYYNNVAKHIIN